MLRTAYRLCANFLNSRFRPHALIHPLMVVYHITNLCNLRCFYCEDFSADKNAAYKATELNTEQVKRILRLLRKKFDYIYLTGGEPLIRPDIEELFDYMVEIKFKRISLNTNGLTLHKFPNVLKHIRDLVISIDSLDQNKKDQIIGMKPGTSSIIFENLKWAAGLQKKYGFELSINCVAAPHTLNDARQTMQFALAEGIKYSCIPQNVGYSAHPELQNNSQFKEFIDEILKLKKRTRLISGTRFFFKNIQTLSPFECYPNTIARVAANGDIYWPCRPLNTFAGNLLRANSYDEAVEEGIRKHGILNACKKSCQMRCYIESSLLVKHPFSLVKEFFTGKNEGIPIPHQTPPSPEFTPLEPVTDTVESVST